MSIYLGMVMNAISVLLNFPVAFLVTVVNIFRNVMECIELCLWILKSEYPPLERFRSGVIRVVGILCDSQLGNCSDIKDFTTSGKLLITIPSEDVQMDKNCNECEIFEDPPTEEITEESTTCNCRRRSTRRRYLLPQAN